MNFPIFPKLRRTGWLILYAFSLSAFLYTQETDTSITISHYQYPEIEGIPIILDETGENTYFLDEDNPVILTDIHINTLQLDGSIGIPIGSYYLPNLLPKTHETDSIQNYSQIYYRKGDYDYSDLGIGLQIETSDSGLFSFQGFKRSPPHPILDPPFYRPNSNILQNHLISYKRYTQNSTVSLDALYHIEDFNLLIKGSDYNRKVESFHGGFGYEYNLGNIYLNLQPSFQFTYMKQWGEEVDNFTFWNDLYSTFHFWSNLNISINYSYKMRLNEYNDQISELPIQILLPSIGYDSEYISLTGGIASFNSTLNPVGMLQFKWNHYYLSGTRNFNVNFIPSENYSLATMEYSINALNAGYNYREFNANMELFKYDGESNWCMRGYGDINLSWIILNQQVGFYNTNKKANKKPVDLFSLTKIIFSPNIWPWNASRFQPFIGMESVYMQYSGMSGIDPINPDVFSNDLFDPFSSHLLNMECGVLVSAFKISYRWVNFNLTGTKVNNSANSSSYPIPPIRHLEVVWQFLD